MFDYIAEYNVTDAAVAGHHAVQLIRQWKAAADRLAVAGDESLTNSQIALITRIVDDIEHTEGRVVGRFTDAQKDKYVLLLSESVRDAARKHFAPSAARGRLLLESLRAAIADGPTEQGGAT